MYLCVCKCLYVCCAPWLNKIYVSHQTTQLLVFTTRKKDDRPLRHRREGMSAAWLHFSDLKSYNSTERIAFGACPPITSIICTTIKHTHTQSRDLYGNGYSRNPAVMEYIAVWFPRGTGWKEISRNLHTEMWKIWWDSRGNVSVFDLCSASPATKSESTINFFQMQKP